MLDLLVTYNSSVTNGWNEVITNVHCRLHILYLEKSFIQEEQENNCQYLSYHLFPLLMLSYIRWLRNNIQHLMVANTDKKNISIHKFE